MAIPTTDDRVIGFILMNVLRVIEVENSAGSWIEAWPIVGMPLLLNQEDIRLLEFNNSSPL